MARWALRTPQSSGSGSGQDNLGVRRLVEAGEQRERLNGEAVEYQRSAGVNMAETVRSLFEYRDPHGDGEGVKAAPPTRG